MIDIAKTGTEGMRMTVKMIAEQALARGWQVKQYYEGTSHLRVTRPDGKRLELYSASVPTVTHVAAIRANNKYFTTVFLRDQDMPVPETYLVQADDAAGARKIATALFETGRRIVVKPLDAGHGDGITVGLATAEQLDAALVRAREYSGKAIIQEYFHEPVDVRITCIDHKFVAALVRLPARVKGDGLHTVGQLIDRENSSSERGENYTSKLTRIDRPGAELYLGDAITDTPNPNEWVRVIGTANVGTGGETVDVTDAIPMWLKTMAEKAARSMELPICGVDFLLSSDPTATATRKTLQPVIIELNHCPSLFIHELPIHGTPRPVVAVFLDYLETL